MNKRNFYNVSILGMVTYCTSCLKSYVLKAYPEQDFSSVLRLAWGIVGLDGYIDENAYRYMETIPEHLFEFDDYEAAELEYLTREEFEELRGLLDPSDQMLDLVMHRIYEDRPGWTDGVPDGGMTGCLPN